MDTLQEKIEREEERLREVEEKFADETILLRLKRLFGGLKMPHDTREYKAAIIEVQRLLSPVLAVVIPVVFVGVLFVVTQRAASDKAILKIEVAEADEDTTLDDPVDVPQPDVEMDPTEVDVQMDAPDTTVEVQNPAETVTTPSPTPQVQNVETVMNIQAPVTMRSVLADTRTAAGRKKSLAKYGGSVQTEAAVMRALRWLKTKQQKDGSWAGSGGFGGCGVTGFVLLTYLAHGEKSGSEEFGKTVQAAIEYIMRKPSHDAMEIHALAESFGMTRNPNIKDYVEADLNKLADRLADTTWGPPRDGSPNVMPNLMTMTFNVMSLRSAKLSKFNIKNADVALNKLRQGFLLQGNQKMGGFSSDHFGPPGPNYRRTGTWHFMMGIVGMQYIGAGNMPIIEKTLQLLDDDWAPPTLETTDIACCPVRGNYWATMVFFNHGGDRWRKWNAQMSRVYVTGQHIVKGKYTDEKGKEHDIGYWTCEDMHIGTQPVMSTCYVVQQLMVYYRYLPTGSKEAWQATPEEVKPLTATDDVQVGGVDDL